MERPFAWPTLYLEINGNDDDFCYFVTTAILCIEKAYLRFFSTAVVIQCEIEFGERERYISR